MKLSTKSLFCLFFISGLFGVESSVTNEINSSATNAQTVNQKNEAIEYLGTWGGAFAPNLSILSIGFRNNSKNTIIAFRGKIIVYNDFSEKTGEHSIEVTSATKYNSPENKLLHEYMPTGPEIKSGETFYYTMVRFPEDGVLYTEIEWTPKQLLETIKIYNPKSVIDDVKSKVKTSFVLEKCVIK